MMVDVGSKKNDLDQIEIDVATEIAERRRHRKKYRPGDQTRIARDVRKRKREPPPVPKNKSLKEIHDMDPQHASLSRQAKTVRKHFVSDNSLELKPDLSFKDSVRADKQRRANERRGKIRKWEAEVTKAQEVLSVTTNGKDHALDIFDEERAIAEGILSLDDWSNEELIRGYRKNRNGKFGKPPRYIPREIQQEAFRRLVQRGNRTLRKAYMKSIEGLIQLAMDAGSEKVRLDAQREILNRVVGKVPDIVVGATMEQPYESILADSIIPISAEPIDMELDDSGIAHMVPYPEDVPRPPSPDSGGPRGGATPTSDVAGGRGATSKPKTGSADRTRVKRQTRKPKKIQDGDPDIPRWQESVVVDEINTQEWEPFTDLLEPGEIPDMGLRIITFLNDKGQRGYKWFGTGDHTLEGLVMILDRVKFLVQFREEMMDMFHNGHTDPMEGGE
jgi:hypothetical protein